MASTLNFDCSPKCSSKAHLYQLISGITKSSEPNIINFISRCHNASKLCDKFGRTLLHVSASCGNKTVVDWLLQQMQIKISAKDLESGWTALHRAFFYGQLDIALRLIQNGAEINIRDREYLTPFELLIKDRPVHIQFTNSGLNEVYAWGTNTNSTLGLENKQSTKIPEHVDFFKREKISIVMVSMNLFHTIFLRDNGHVYVCGHGQDGRLGLGSEKPILAPTLVNTLTHEKCIYISAALNQSYFLMENGSILSCGLNTYYQLAHYQYAEKSLIPKLVNIKNLKITKVDKIFGLKYHTIIFADNNFYTWGLNSGQIGHGKLPNTAIITSPRIVNQIMKGVTLTHIAACDNVTAFVTSKGDLFIMQDYICKKVIHRLLGISHICVAGGKLDSLNDPDKGKFSSCIKLVGSTILGKMFIWNSDENLVRHIHWNQFRPAKTLDFSLSLNNIVVVTTDGDCFTCQLQIEHCQRPFSVCGPVKDMLNDFKGKSLTDLVSEMEFVSLTVHRLPAVYRAHRVFCNPKSPNVILLQASPNASLTAIPFESASVFADEIKELLLQSDELYSNYDVILKFNNETFNCHRFILCQKSNFFQNLFTNEDKNIDFREEIEDKKEDSFFHLITNNNSMTNEYYYFNEDCSVPIYQINFDNISSSIFLQLLIFLYTGTCEFIQPGSSLLNFCSKKFENQSVKNLTPKSKKKKVPTATLR